jgi:branched-chain amino acid aminotransferase
MADNSSTAAETLVADKVWIDGRFVKWDEGRVHIMTHALHYGLGVFEGIRAYKTHDGRLAIFRLKEHIRRFFESAHIILLKIPYTQDQLCDACVELLRQQRDRFANGAYLRPIAFMGDGAMGLGAINPTRVAITAWDWGAYLGEKGIRDGIRAKVSSFTRMHVNVNMVRGKITGQYVNEASGENVFCVNRYGIVRTPPLSSPILSGITRDTILKVLRDAEREVQEVTFTRDALYIADEVFFCGTAAEITPVREVDNRQVADGKPGKQTRWVQEQYARIVRGQEPKYADWLTYL